MHKVPEFIYFDGKETILIQNKTQFCENIYKSESFDLIYDKLILNESESVINWAYDLKLVCNTRKILALIGTVYFLASICTNLALSKFADMFGRRNIYLLLNLISFLSLFQLLYLKHLSQLIFTSFVLGVSSLNLAIGSVIINETVDKKYSGLVMGISNAMFPFGGLVNIFFMYFFKNWYYYLIFTIVLCVACNILGFIYLEESPKWQYANQYHKDFLKTVEVIAKLNGTNDLSFYDELFKLKQTKNNSIIKLGSKNEEYRTHVYGWYDLVKYPSLRLLTLKNIYLWIFTGFSFFGVLLNLEGLTGDFYVDGIVAYSAEIIAEIGSGAVSSYFGRRNISIISFLLAGVSTCLFSIFKIEFLKIVFLFLSAIGIASGFNVLYIYSAELYPTNVRSLSISVFSLFNRLAASTIPILLTYTSNITPLICVLSFVASFVAFSMQESITYDAGDEIKELKEDIYELEGDKCIEGEKTFMYFHDVFDSNF